jgi:hypothetical protein
MSNDIYIPDLPWSIVKSYLLTFDKSRQTKSCKLIKGYCTAYQELLDDGDIIPDTSFCFVYFFSMMRRKRNFNYSLFPSEGLMSIVQQHQAPQGLFNLNTLTQ